MTELVRNTNTGQIGAIVKHCRKTVKVCIEHPTIKNAHAYRYWSNIETAQPQGQAMKEKTIEQMTPEEMGERLAFFLRWDGQDITDAFLAALTEANFHQLREQLQPIIKKHLGA